MKILIVEDEAVSRRLLHAYLQQLGYEVTAAENGAEAWRLFQADQFHIVLSDWLMPEMDGLELIRRIRAAPCPGYVYTLLLTAKSEKQDLVAGMDAGADDFIAKPFDRDELRVRLRAGQRVVELETALLNSLDELQRAREKEIGIGARIQKELLQGRAPRTLPGVRVAAVTLPSQQIDGDFYDFYLHSHRCLDLVVGDVMGKGVPAALLGAAIKNSFSRALSRLLISLERDRLPEPEEILTLVHGEMTPRLIRLEQFATLCYTRFDLNRRKVVFVDCGHTKTLHFRDSTCAVERLEGPNLPMGFSEAETYRQVSAPFDAGDMFLFYSDGVTETENPEGELFAEERLAELIRVNGRREPQEVIEKITSAVVEFSRSEQFADDLTCVAVRIEKWPSRSAARVSL
jgi:sigma-B regulation protein RsbU (phosphoserine phosphatase)